MIKTEKYKFLLILSQINHYQRIFTTDDTEYRNNGQCARRNLSEEECRNVRGKYPMD